MTFAHDIKQNAEHMKISVSEPKIEKVCVTCLLINTSEFMVG